MIQQSKPLTTLKEVQDVYNFFFASDSSPLVLWTCWEFTGPKRYGATKSDKPLVAADYACYPAMLVSANLIVPVPVLVADTMATVRLHFNVNGFRYIETVLNFNGKSNVTALEVFNSVMESLSSEQISDTPPISKESSTQNNDSDGELITYKAYEYRVHKLENGSYIVKNVKRGNMELGNGTRKKAIIKLYEEKQKAN